MPTYNRHSTPAIYNNGGIKTLDFPVEVVAPAGIFQDNQARGLKLYQATAVSLNVALAAAGVVSLTALGAGQYYNIGMLVVDISVAGTVQFLSGALVVMQFTLLANQSFAVPLPKDGLVGQSTNTDFKVKNSQGGAVTVNVSYSFGVYS